MPKIEALRQQEQLRGLACKSEVYYVVSSLEAFLYK